MRYRPQVKLLVLLCLSCAASCAQRLGSGGFEPRLAIYVCDSSASSGLLTGEPVLRAGSKAEVLRFSQFCDGSGIFTFEDGSPVSGPLSVPSECLRALSSFSPYFPEEEGYFPLAQSSADLEATGGGDIPFSVEAPAIYVAVHRDGSFELGTHSETRVDSSSRPDYYKAKGRLFADHDFIVAKGESADSTELRNFYFTAVRNRKGGISIFGATELVDH
jgi:hypothetical protein